MAVTVATVKTYLAGTGYRVADWSDAAIQQIIDAEFLAQSNVVKSSSLSTADVELALHRRVYRAMTVKSMPTGVQQGDADGGSVILPGRDPEIRRLEAPHRRLPVG